VRNHPKSPEPPLTQPADNRPNEPPSAPGPQGASTVFIAAVVCSGAGVVGYGLSDLASRPISHEWLILLALTVATDLAALRIPGMPISFSISDIFSIASALVFGPSAGAVTAALDGLVLSARMGTSQRSLSRIAFNVSAPAIAWWTASQLFAALAGAHYRIDGPLTALWLLTSLAAFGALAYGVNTGLVAIAVSLERRTPVAKIWQQHFSGLWLNYFGGVFGGMLLMLLASLHTLDVIILLAPLPIILYMAFKHAIGRTQDQISHLGKVNCVYVAAIEALAQAVDAKDQVTHDHVRRVQTQSVDLAHALGLNDDAEVQAIKAASLLHDIGKLAIPEHILNKPGRLTTAEYDIMKRHAPIGADILQVVDFPYPVAPIVRHHHENWDGTGYPDGLVGEDIPIGARIIAVVDCFDALTSDRPYRPRLEDAAALQVIAERRATMYDPRVVDAFFVCHGAYGVDAPDPPAIANNQPSASVTAADGPSRSSTLELEAFFYLGRALERARDLQPIDILWTHLQPHLPPATLVLYVYDPARDAIVAAGEAGEIRSGLCDGTTVPLGARLSGWVAATGQSVMNSDARLDLDDAARERSPLRSALAVAMSSEGRVVGVLSAYARQPDAFNESHRRVMQAAAVVLGTLDLRSPGASRTKGHAACPETAHSSPTTEHAA
jgi:putative nucleotidyltransferase with HDIG domain